MEGCASSGPISAMRLLASGSRNTTRGTLSRVASKTPIMEQVIMCLAVPMTLIERGVDDAGVVELEGVRRAVRLELVPEAVVGDYVIVHAGYAIERLNRDEADARLQLFDRLVAAAEHDLGVPVRLANLPPERA